MKRLLCLALSFCMLFCLCACKNTSQKTNSEDNKTEAKNTLLYALAGTNNLSDIKSFKITHAYSDSATEITNINDLAFLKEYTYSHKYPSEDMRNLFVYPDNSLIEVITKNKETKTVRLTQDGSLVLQNIIDEDTMLISQDVYTADGKNVLNKEKFVRLLNKYEGYDITLDQNVYTPQSINDLACIKDEGGNILLGKGDFDTVQAAMVENTPCVLITFTEKGKTLFAKATAENIGKTLSLYVGEDIISRPIVQTVVTEGQTVIEVEDVEAAIDIVKLLKK